MINNDRSEFVKFAIVQIVLKNQTKNSTKTRCFTFQNDVSFQIKGCDSHAD